VCSEVIGQGTDTILINSATFNGGAGGTYDMSAKADNVENLTATGKIGLDLIGNDLDNRITGTSGNDTLNSWGGVDTLIGGAGNDTYYVYNIPIGSEVLTQAEMVAEHMDVIIDSSGIDTLVLSGNYSGTPPGNDTYTLQPSLERLDAHALDSRVIITLAGNSGNNTITDNSNNGFLYGMAGNDSLQGGAGNEVLNGGLGADTMNGGGGQDTYIIDNAKDLIIDTFDQDPATPDEADISVSYVMNAAAHVDKIVLAAGKQINYSEAGNPTGELIMGNAMHNIIHGGTGNDTIHGGGGHDILYGGGGGDTFVFDAGMASKTQFNLQEIMDFVPNEVTPALGDKLDISALLTGYSTGNIVAEWVRVVDFEGNSLVFVNPTADGVSSDWVHIATLHGITGISGEQDLLNDFVLVAATAGP
jgi:Ca2+-binding RTX toxin-like protein